VRRRATRLLLVLSVVGAAAEAEPCAAQVEAGLDAAASVVKYDGYLASGAANLTPSVVWRSPRTTLAARGTLMVFESGNTNLQALLSAGTFSPPSSLLRLEIAAEAGASTYAGVAQFAHALGRVRAHLQRDRWGFWAGPLLGAVASGGGAGGASGLSAGWWARVPASLFEITWTRVAVGDTAYTDLEARVRWQRGAFDVQGSADGRGVSRGGGSGLYGDASATLQLTDRMALIVAAGTYPSDPVNGSIGGSYVTAGVRLAPRPSPRVAVARYLGSPAASREREVPARLEGVRAALEQVDNLSVLVVQVAGARRVEVMGDFTEWQPAVLAEDGGGRYRYPPGLPPGMHRFNVRVDGGPWGVPRGAGMAADEFGGSVGVMVVP
jgi:hypothetical protein